MDRVFVLVMQLGDDVSVFSTLEAAKASAELALPGVEWDDDGGDDGATYEALNDDAVIYERNIDV